MSTRLKLKRSNHDNLAENNFGSIIDTDKIAEVQ
jgi:hypothetical protein